MAAKPKKALAKSNTEIGVDAFMAGLAHPLQAEIEAVRKLILGLGPAIGEGIKWNAPSFRKADWFATVHLRSRDALQLVFHTGAKAQDNPDFEIPDRDGLIKWLAKDRCLVTLGAGKTFKANTKAFEAIVTAWIRYV